MTKHPEYDHEMTDDQWDDCAQRSRAEHAARSQADLDADQDRYASLSDDDWAAEEAAFWTAFDQEFGMPTKK
jgi:hypothetical protein